SIRLTRGRALLRKRLARRGLALSSGLLTMLLAQTAEGTMPAALVSATIRYVLLYGAEATAGAAVIPESITTLVEGVMKGMRITRLKIAATVLCVLGTLGLGTGLWLQQVLAAPKTELASEVANPPLSKVKKDL